MTSTIVHWLAVVAGYVFLGALVSALLAAVVGGFIKAQGRRQAEEEAMQRFWDWHTAKTQERDSERMRVRRLGERP
jgi:hypothetical protein